jgi:hypothetical protein
MIGANAAWILRLLQEAPDEAPVEETPPSPFMETLSACLKVFLPILVVALLLGLGLYFLRRRLARNPRFTSLHCPACRHGLIKVHRRLPDRALSLLVPVARYRCRACQVSVLRVVK